MTARSSARRASGSAGHGLFLSYNSVDRDAVLKVRAALEQRAAATFLDRRDLTPGLPWITALEDALRRVKAVAVFVGSGGMGAWQKREMQVAIDHQAHEEEAGRAFPVIPVLLPLAETATAPAFLLLNTWIDLRHRLDDVAALDLLAATSRGVAPAAAPAEAAILALTAACRRFARRTRRCSSAARASPRSWPRRSPSASWSSLPGHRAAASRRSSRRACSRSCGSSALPAGMPSSVRPAIARFSDSPPAWSARGRWRSRRSSVSSRPSSWVRGCATGRYPCAPPSTWRWRNRQASIGSCWSSISSRSCSPLPLKPSGRRSWPRCSTPLDRRPSA